MMTSSSPADGPTVVITSCRRPDLLREAFHSCYAAGVKDIVVSNSGTVPGIDAALSDIRKTGAKVTHRADDAGCNESWMRGVALVKTKYLTILHDDDRLTPEYNWMLGESRKADLVHYNGGKHGGGSGGYSVFPQLPQGIHPSALLFSYLLRKDRLAISPVSGVYPTDTAMDALIDAEKLPRSCYIKPSMLVGNDLLIWLRAARKIDRFQYVHTPLVSYGHQNGSVTYDDVRTGTNKLPAIYNTVRDHFLESFPVVNHIVQKPFAQDPETVRRETEARQSWEYFGEFKFYRRHEIGGFNRGSNDFGDARNLPYLKDALEAGMEKCDKPDDILMFTNNDTVLNRWTLFVMLDEVRKHGATCAVRSDYLKGQPYDLEEYPTARWPRCDGGRDLFAFTKEWLRAFWKEIPDFVLGAPCWDSVLAMIIRKATGVAILKHELVVGVNEMPPFLVLHESHDSYWNSKRYELRANQHNLGLANSWLKRNVNFPHPY